MIKNWKGIVFHHTGVHDSLLFQSDGIKDYHIARKWQEIGYHFIVEKCGGYWWLVCGRPLSVAGAHCKGHNHLLLGFAFMGNFMVEKVDIQMLKFAVPYIKWLMDMYNIPKKMLFEHRQLNNTDCPGKNFNINTLLNLL